MTLGMALAVASVAMLAAVASGAHAATPRAWYWSEAQAERLVLQKVRVPCLRVRKKARCDVAVARSRWTRAAEASASCDSGDDIYGALDCVSAEATANEARWEYERVSRGFPVETTECIGGGQEDASGFRFSSFRCKIVVVDRRYDGAGFARGEVNVAGRIVVYATGAKTFRWKIIS